MPGFQCFFRPSLLLQKLNNFRLNLIWKWPQLRYFHRKPLIVKNYCLKSESPGKRTEIERLEGCEDRGLSCLLMVALSQNWALFMTEDYGNSDFTGRHQTCMELAAFRNGCYLSYFSNIGLGWCKIDILLELNSESHETWSQVPKMLVWIIS